MSSLDFSLQSSIAGGKITSFNYSHSLRELVGSWSALIAGGSFNAGDTFSINGLMMNGIIASAFKDNSGLWHLEGKDAGYRLINTFNSVDDFPETKSFKGLISSLAAACSVTTRFSSLDTDEQMFDVRSLISGSTYAEAILELAMFYGCIAFFNHEGLLVIQPPNRNKAFLASLENNNNIINDSGSSLDLDGYATHVAVVLSYQLQNEDNIEDDEPPDEYIGEAPPLVPYNEYHSGSLPNGSYNFTIQQPFGVLSQLQTVITDGNVTITTTENHNFDSHIKTLWRDNQEFALYAFIERSYSIQREAVGSYSSSLGTLSFSETTTENMQRTMSTSNVFVGIPPDWQNEGLDMVSSEAITRSTVRTGGKSTTQDMPAYSPPFDSRITRSYSRQYNGKALLCNETEEHYEARQVGSVAPIKKKRRKHSSFLHEL